MSKDRDDEIHFLGEFCLGNNTMQGELIHNKSTGAIYLSIRRETHTLDGVPVDNGSVITGKLQSGAPVSLYNCRCVRNHTQYLAYQDLLFRSSHIVFGEPQSTFNQLVCVLENGLQWGGLSQIDISGFSAVTFKPVEERVFHWFGAKTSFSTTLENDLYRLPRFEESRVTERLTVTIDSEEKREPAFFMAVRDKIISLISFAIKDNVNIEEQFLVDYDEYELIGDYKNYTRRSFISSEPHSAILGRTYYDYNFTLKQISGDNDPQACLEKLEPVLNLYLSLFKYPNMPPEMVFLNIVQALETFHSRFFYDDRKENYVRSVYKRFSGLQNFEKLKGLLLNDTQMDENCRYIILTSRLNDLFIGAYNGLFGEFYLDGNFAQTVADTRHYYTHYSKSKEAKALRGYALLDAVFVLRLLLEYHICRVLNIDISEATRRQLMGRRISRSESRGNGSGKAP